MEPECSLKYSQESTTGSYCEPAESSATYIIKYWVDINNSHYIQLCSRVTIYAINVGHVTWHGPDI
jgi:hypothetical protein